MPAVARTWLVITVELVSGGDNEKDFWPRPGRTFIAARTQTFEQLAEAIDDAFGRWDLNHLHEFAMADGTCVAFPIPTSTRAGSSSTPAALGSVAFRHVEAD